MFKDRFNFSDDSKRTVEDMVVLAVIWLSGVVVTLGAWLLAYVFIYE